MFHQVEPDVLRAPLLEAKPGSHPSFATHVGAGEGSNPSELARHIHTMGITAPSSESLRTGGEAAHVTLSLAQSSSSVNRSEG